MEFRITPLSEDLVEDALRQYRSARRRLTKDLYPGRAPTRQELLSIVRSLDEFQLKSVPSSPITGKLWRVDLRPRRQTELPAGEHVTMIFSRCPKPDGLVTPIVVQNGTPLATAALAMALAATTGPVILDGGEFYGVHPIWDGRDFNEVMRDIADCLKNAIDAEEYTNQEELAEQLGQIQARFDLRSKRSRSTRKPFKSSRNSSAATTQVIVDPESPEWRAVLIEVLRNPFEDAPRLASADWLEQRGCRDRAEFIRAQIEHDKMVVPQPCDRAVKRFQASCKVPSCKQCSASLLAMNQRVKLRETANRLLSSGSNIRQWCGIAGLKRTWNIVYARGFVEGVNLQIAEFIAHARAIFGAAPITKVGLVNVSPKAVVVPQANRRPAVAEVWLRDTSSQVTRRTSHSNRLPGPIFDRLPGAEGEDQLEFLTPGEARWALDLACVDFGRELAGLPPLTHVAASLVSRDRDQTRLRPYPEHS